MKCQYPNNAGSTGYCKGCRCARCKAAKAESRRRYLGTPEGRAKHYAANQRGRNPEDRHEGRCRRAACARKGVSRQMIRDLATPEYCPILPNIRMEWENERVQGQTSDGCPEIDKIRPELGYVEGNMRWVSARGNRLKDNATLTELWYVLRDAIANQ